MPVSLFPLLLAAHVSLAIGLFLPSILLPFALRRRAGSDGSAEERRRRRFVRLLLWLQSSGTVLIGLGLALSGAALLSVLGPELVRQPWLLAALTIYALNLGLAFFIQRPNLRRLVGFGGPADDDRWHLRARRQRYVSYAMAGLVGTIGFLMSTKPELW